MAKTKKPKGVYTPYSRLSKMARGKKMYHKQICNQLHAEMVTNAEQKQIGVTWDTQLEHAVLGDPSENFQSARTLIRSGVRKNHVHVPNPFVFESCRDLGVCPVYNCLLSELPQQLPNAIWASVFFDSTGQFSDSTIKELNQFLKGALNSKAPPFFVISLTVAGSRAESKVEWINRVDSALSDIVNQLGYVIHDPQHYRKYYTYTPSEWKGKHGATMHFFSWMLCRFQTQLCLYNTEPLVPDPATLENKPGQQEAFNAAAHPLSRSVLTEILNDLSYLEIDCPSVCVALSLKWKAWIQKHNSFFILIGCKTLTTLEPTKTMRIMHLVDLLMEIVYLQFGVRRNSRLRAWQHRIILAQDATGFLVLAPWVDRIFRAWNEGPKHLLE